MPYIPKEDRQWFIPTSNLPADSPGELNFQITVLVNEYLRKTPNYTRFNAAIGVLESAKLELYRRMVAPYEDGKRAENGDVY